MSTTSFAFSSAGWGRVLSQNLQDLIAALEADSSLFEPKLLRTRLDALDELESRFGDFNAKEFMNDADARIHHNANAIRTRIESANAEVYESIRATIVSGDLPDALLPWIQGSDETASPARGLGYDYRDEIASGVLQLREPSEPRLDPLPEMMFYQPTPVRHILNLRRVCALSEDEVFVDLGSGLGHVALLASMLTGVQSVGIEMEAAYVASAQECAHSLRLGRVRFIQEDARAADLSRGTVFYLYSPFTGSILAEVLDRLQKESTSRLIKICTLGPCTCTLAKESWLKPITPPDPVQITVFQRRL